MVVGLGSRTANASRVAQGTEDVTFVLPNNTDPIILGVGMDDDAGARLRPEIDGDPESTLQFRTGAGAFVDVLLASGAVRCTAATDLVDGNAVTSGERLSTGTGAGAFVDGREMEAENAWTAVEVRNDFTEWQIGLDFSNAAASTTYDFRMSWEMKDGESFVTYISITTAAGGPTFVDLDASITPGSVMTSILTPLAFLVAAITPAATITAAFAPQAHLVSAITPSSATTAALAPDALLVASITPGATTTSALTPLAFLVASITPSSTPTAALTVTLDFDGAITPGSTTTALLTPYAFLASSTTPGATTTAVLAPFALLVSAITPGTTPTAVLTPYAFLVSSITPGATITSSLDVFQPIDLVASITPGSTITGLLTPYAFLDSATTPGTTPTAVLTPYAFLDSSITPGTTTTSDLSVGDNVDLDASITPGATVTALLTPYAFLVSGITPGTTPTAFLTPYAFLVSSVTPGATTIGVLQVGVHLVASITPGATTTAALSATADLASAIIPGSTTTAVLTPYAFLVGAITPGATITGGLEVGILFVGAITPGTTTTALLDLHAALSASITPGTVTTAILTPYAFLVGSITPGSTITAAVDVFVSGAGILIGTALGTSTATAFAVPIRSRLLAIRRTAGLTTTLLDFGVEHSDVVFQVITRISGPQLIIGREDVPEGGLMLGLAQGTSSATATLAGTGAMVGSAQGTSTATAVPTDVRLMVGQANGTSTAEAFQGVMLGQANGTSTADGFLEQIGAMVGQADGTSTAEAFQGVMLGLATGASSATSKMVGEQDGVLFGIARGTSSAAAFQGVMLGQANGTSEANAIPATLKGAIDDIIELDKPGGFTENYLVRCVLPIEPTAVNPPPLYINDIRAQEEVVARDARGFASEIEVTAPVSVALTDPDDVIRVVLNESGKPGGSPDEDPTGPFADDLTGMFLRVKVENFPQAFRANIFTYAAPTVRENGLHIKNERFYSRFVIEGGGTTEVLQVFAYIIRRSDVPVFEVCIDIRNGAIDPTLSHYLTQSKQDGRVYLEWIEIGGIPITHGITTWAERPTMDLAGGHLLRPAPELVGGQPNHRYLMHPGAWMRRRLVVHRNGFGSRTGSVQEQRGRGRTVGPDSYYRRGQFGPDGVTIPQWNSDFAFGGETGQAALKLFFGGTLSSLRNDLRTGSTTVATNPEQGWMRPFGDHSSGAGGGTDIMQNSSHAHCEEGWHLHRELSDLSVERSWAWMGKASDGALTDLHVWAAEGVAGKTPWTVDNLGNAATAHPFSLHPLTGSNRALMFTGHLWNNLELGNVNAFPRTDLLNGAALPFRPRNITHSVRTWYNARAVAWFSNDWPTVDFIHAMDAYYGWQANSYGVDPLAPAGPWFATGRHVHGVDLPFARQFMIDNSIQFQAQIGFNRNPGWGWHLVTMRHALGTTSERALESPRLDIMHLLAFEHATPLGMQRRGHLIFPCNSSGAGVIHPFAEGLFGTTNIPGSTGAFPDKFADWGTCAIPVVEPMWDTSQPHLTSYFMQALFGIYFRRYLNLDATKAANALSDAVRVMRANFAAIGIVGNAQIQLHWRTGDSDYLGVFLAPAPTFTLWTFVPTGGPSGLDLEPQTWCGMLFVADANTDFLLHHWPALQGFNSPSNTFASVVQEFMQRSSPGGQWFPPSVASLSVANAAWPCALAQRQLAAPPLPPPST